MTDIATLLRAARLVAVLTIERTDDAVPLDEHWMVRRDADKFSSLSD